jgi:hypothetical protein
MHLFNPPQEFVMSLVAMSPLLRRALTADALVSLAAAFAMTLGADFLSAWLQLPTPLLLGAGLSLFPWAGFLMWLARKPAVPSAAVWTVLAINALWIAESAWIALGGQFSPNAWGLAFIAAQGLAVLVLLELEFMGLRRSGLAAA